MNDYINKYLNRKEEYLPLKLVDKIINEIFNESRYQKRTKNNFLKCIGIIYHKQIHECHSRNFYVATGKAYWKKVFGGNYHSKVIKPLLDYGIIQSHDFGYRTFPDKANKTERGKPQGKVGIRYRINPELIEGKSTSISYFNSGDVLSAEEIISNKGRGFDYTEIPDKNFNITIDQAKANSWVDEQAHNICEGLKQPKYIDELPDKYWIAYFEYIEGGTYNPEYSTILAIKNIAKTKGLDFFYFNKSFYLAPIDEFLKQREDHLKYHYKQEISKVGLPLVEKRSPLTLRSYSYLTNFPSKILQFININGVTVVQIDLRTSQFLLFANLLNVYLNEGEKKLISLFKQEPTNKYLKRLISVLKDHQALLPSSGVDLDYPRSTAGSYNDTIKFIRETFFEDFYAIMQKQFGFSSRGLAKQMLFKMLFRRTNKSDDLIDLVAKRYPVVMSIISEFKKKDKTSPDEEDSESNFSVFLQCVESEIFIDNILYPLRAKGIPCFARHDSIVVAAGKEDEVEGHIKEVFAGYGFKRNYKIEEKMWEVIDPDQMVGYSDSIPEDAIDCPDYSNDTVQDEPDEESVLEEYQHEILERLREIGFQEDYYEFVNIDLLEEIANLPFHTTQQRNCLYDEVINIKSDMNFFQTQTNEIIRNLIIYG